METRGTREFTKSVQKLHQQFQYYKDRSNRRFQDLEDLIEVAAMNIEILKKKKLQTHRKTKVMNPFARKEPSDKHSKEPLHHFPKFNEGSEVLGSVVGTGSKVNEWPNLTEELLYAPQETYTMKPIYDEEPEKSHKCWLDQPYTQSKACADPNEMVERRNQPRSSADSSVSTRTGDSLKFGKVTNLRGNSQEDNGSSTSELEVSLPAIAGTKVIDDYPDEEEADGNATEVVLSALGINESKHNQPTQSPRYCYNRSISVLIDCESNLNLVSSRVCTDFGLPLEPQSPISITLPNGEVQEWWPEKEFISAALEGGEPKSHNLCLYCPEFEDFPHIWKQICILIWPKEGIAKSLANKTKKVSGYGGRNYIKFGEQIVNTFDPGGYVPDDQSKELHKLKRKVYVVQFVDSADLRDQDIQKSNGEVDRILIKMNQRTVVPMGAGLKVLPFRYQYMVLEQNRPEINKTTEGYEVSRIKVTIYIFDPGGDQYTSCRLCGNWDEDCTILQVSIHGSEIR